VLPRFALLSYLMSHHLNIRSRALKKKEELARASAAPVEAVPTTAESSEETEGAATTGMKLRSAAKKKSQKD
jgi:hypothetical protein